MEVTIGGLRGRGARGGKLGIGTVELELVFPAVIYCSFSFLVYSHAVRGPCLRWAGNAVVCEASSGQGTATIFWQSSAWSWSDIGTFI